MHQRQRSISHMASVSAGICGVFSYPLTPRGPGAPWSPLGPRFPRHGPGTPLHQIHLPCLVSLFVFDAVSTQTAVTQAAPLSALPIEPRGARRSIAARAPPSPSIALTTLRAGGPRDAAHSMHVSTAQTLACVWPRSQERFDSSLCALLPTLARHPLIALWAWIAVRAFHTLRASWPSDSSRPATKHPTSTVRSDLQISQRTKDAGSMEGWMKFPLTLAGLWGQAGPGSQLVRQDPEIRQVQCGR